MNSKRLPFAKADPATSMASLFRPVTKGRRPKGLEVSTRWGESVSLTFFIHTGLDTKDQTSLLTLIALAGLGGKRLTSTTDAPTGRGLWLELNSPGDPDYSGEAVVVETTYNEMITAADTKASGRAYESIKASLSRLSRVIIEVETKDEVYSQHLLSYRISKVTGRLIVALNSRICAALSGQYVRIALDERSMLSSDPAKVAHAWLCAWLRPGRTQRIHIDTLSEKVWGSEAIQDYTRRKRRKTLRAAIIEISGLPGWKAEESEDGQIAVSRSAIIEHEEQDAK